LQSFLYRTITSSRVSLGGIVERILAQYDLRCCLSVDCQNKYVKTRQPVLNRDLGGGVCAHSAIHIKQLDEPEVAIAFDQVAFDFLNACHLHHVMRYMARSLIVGGTDKLAHDRDKHGAQA